MLRRFYTPSTLTISEYKFWNSLEVLTISQIPIVRVACSEGQNISTTEKTVSFTVMPEGACWNSFDSAEVFSDDEAPSNYIQTTWAPLPERFGFTSTGLVVEFPWSAENDSRIVTGCSVDARWAKGLVSQSLVFNVILQPFGGGPDYLSGAVSTLIDSKSCSAKNNWSIFTPLPNCSWSHIDLDQGWLQALTPVSLESATDQLFQNASTLEYLLSKNAID